MSARNLLWIAEVLFNLLVVFAISGGVLTHLWRTRVVPPHPRQRIRLQMHRAGGRLAHLGGHRLWYGVAAAGVAAIIAIWYLVPRNGRLEHFWLLAGRRANMPGHAARSNVHISVAGVPDPHNTQFWSSVDFDQVRTKDGWQLSAWLDPNSPPIEVRFYDSDPAGTVYKAVATISPAEAEDRQITLQASPSARSAFDGTVEDEHAAPIRGALVRLVATSYSSTTDANGSFTFPLNEATTKPLLLLVSAPGFQRVVAWRLENQEHVTIQLRRA